MKNRLIYTVAITAVAAGLLIACGNGDDDDTTPTADAGADSGVKEDASAKLDAAASADASTTPDSSTGTDSGPAADAATDAATDAGAPTFTAVYGQILSGICATCHGGANGSGAKGGKLLMDSYDDAYANLVGVTSTGEACGGEGLERVVAGSSATSLLWEKVSETTPPCGSRMPLDNTPLTQAQQDLIAAWINAGALKN
jgi:mono/diheme cytochrome c family protein